MDNTFTKKDSQAMKGIAILLMLLHHLFYRTDSSGGLPVSFLLLTQKQMIAVARFCKICVPAFVFVTAYGMAIKYKKCRQGRESLVQLTLSRYRSLMTPFLFVYVLMFLFCQIGGMRSYAQIYGSGIKSIVYMLADLLGLTYFTDTPTMNPTWWYMSVAQLLLLVLPLIFRAVQKMDLAVLLLFGITFFIGGKNVQKNQAVLCLFVAAVGVWCEKQDIFGKWIRFCKREEKVGFRRILGMTFCVISVILLFAFKTRRGNAAWIVAYPCSAVILAAFVCCMRTDGRVQKILCFFGRYSMYMFLTHTFLKSYYLHDFIYGMQQAEIIYFVLLLLSLILAVSLDFLYRKWRDIQEKRRKKNKCGTVRKDREE